MFGGNSPRRQSVPGYPGYHQAAASTAAGYDYAGVSGAAHVYADQQWSGYHHLYGRYDDWNHHAAAAAVAAAQFQQSPSSPGASLDTETSTSTSLLYNYNKPVTSALCPPAVSGDFKPPLFGDPRSVSGGEESVIPGSRVTAGHDHHSPDSGLAASDAGVSGSDSPSHAHQPQQSSSPVLHHDLPSRPQPARSPYEWMKRPSVGSRPSKEGSDGNSPLIMHPVYTLIIECPLNNFGY